MVAIAERPTIEAHSGADLTPLTERVQYGSTELRVSRLCWGTGLMADLKHNLSPAEAARILVRGFALGVNFWDTADGYKTHPHVREALKSVPRDQVVISTKTQGKTAKAAAADVDRFLTELGTDVLDCVLLHGVETVEEFDLRQGALEALLRAKAAGKVRVVGITTHLGTGEIMERCASDPRLEVVLTTVNKDGLMLKAGPAVLPQHLTQVEAIHKAGKGICLMKTLAQGGLTKTPEMVAEAIRFNLGLPYAHSVCVGVNSVEEVEFAVRVANQAE